MLEHQLINSYLLGLWMIRMAPPQARYGSAFLGADFVIDSGRRQDYVNLTLQLIQDPLFYTSRSKHAISCYNKHADVKAYVKEFEEIISTSLKIG